MGEEGDDAQYDLIVESTGLDHEQVDSLKKGFEGFDKEGGGTITQTTMQMILKSMGVKVDKEEMDGYAAEMDEEAAGKFTFEQFCQVAAKFMVEDDVEQMKEELKEAFRIYDKEGQGFITTDVLKEILREIDTTLTEEDLDNIVEEVDEDASGTLDFDEFQEMMMG
jgi:Ca2+-binding EF-hand superfamily protein